MSRLWRGLLYVAAWWTTLPWPPPIRAWWLRRLGATIGRQAVIHRCHFINLEVHGFGALRIGAGAHIGPECMLDLAQPIEIGDRVALAPRVTILTHADPGESAVRQRHPRTEGPVVIGADAWIGSGATILHSVRIGAGAVVGAASLVRADVQPGQTVAGVPAQDIPDLA